MVRPSGSRGGYPISGLSRRSAAAPLVSSIRGTQVRHGLANLRQDACLLALRPGRPSLLGAPALSATSLWERVQLN